MNIKFQDISLDVVPDRQHEWLLETTLVAEGYAVKPATVRQTKSRNESEFVEGRHYVLQNVTIANGGQKPKVFWTKRGVITLGFFITSEKAKQFRMWAEDLILKVLERPVDKIQTLEQHTKREVQITNSKDVNSYLFKNWDVETLIDYNRKNCQMVSGHSPSELKKIIINSLPNVFTTNEAIEAGKRYDIAKRTVFHWLKQNPSLFVKVRHGKYMKTST